MVPYVLQEAKEDMSDSQWKSQLVATSLKQNPSKTNEMKNAARDVKPKLYQEATFLDICIVIAQQVKG